MSAGDQQVPLENKTERKVKGIELHRDLLDDGNQLGVRQVGRHHQGQPSRSFLPGAEDIAGECIPSSEHVVNEQNRFDRREAVAVGRAAREPV